MKKLLIILFLVVVLIIHVGIMVKNSNYITTLEKELELSEKKYAELLDDYNENMIIVEDLENNNNN